MIFGLGKTTLAAAYILAATGCPPLPPMGDLGMEFTNTPPVITIDKSAAELGRYTISTTFSRSNNEIFTVGGLLISDFAPQYQIDFKVSPPMSDGRVCVAPYAAKIIVHYAPRILIARETPPGSCQYKVTLDHEMRHVGIDVASLNEYLPRMQRAMDAAVKAIPPMGPMAVTSIEKARDIMVDKIRAELVKQVEEFELVRLNRQQLIDTRQEYLRTSKLCR